MNLSYVKDFLQARKENITEQDIDCLIEEINSYQGTENTFRDISKIMRVINEYNLTFLTLVGEFDALPRNKDTLIQRVDRARGILCTLSTLHTYLALSISNVKESTYNMKMVRNYITELVEKREHFKTEKMAWITILKSLTQEMNYISEMRRMDIDDKVGYSNLARK